MPLNAIMWHIMMLYTMNKLLTSVKVEHVLFVDIETDGVCWCRRSLLVKKESVSLLVQKESSTVQSVSFVYIFSAVSNNQQTVQCNLFLFTFLIMCHCYVCNCCCDTIREFRIH